MPKDKPTTGPMRTQPIDRAWAMHTPMMPVVGGTKDAPKPKQKPTRSEAIRAAKAKITRRNSLLKQRTALKG
jgi:hypothetical protein